MAPRCVRCLPSDVTGHGTEIIKRPSLPSALRFRYFTVNTKMACGLVLTVDVFDALSYHDTFFLFENDITETGA